MSEQSQKPNISLHQTKLFVTHLACARSAPNSFAGETNVKWTGNKVGIGAEIPAPHMWYNGAEHESKSLWG